MMTTVSEEWGMSCPRCNKDDKIFISGRIELLMTPDGTENTCSNYYEWDDNSFAHCGYCFYDGAVQHFKIRENV